MAAELCELHLKKYPGDANFLCLAAMANLAMRNFGIALQRVEEAIRAFPEFALAHETYGDLMLARSRSVDALKAYEQALRLNPTRSLIHDKIERAKAVPANGDRLQPVSTMPKMAFVDEIGRALEHERSGDPQSAEMIYREVLKKDPDHTEAARLLAGIAAANKRFRDAEVFLKRVVELAPDHTRAWVDLANVQRELDKFNDAIESASEVLRLSPASAESHMVYAAAIGMAGDHEGAIAAYLKALEIAPKRAVVFCGMAHHQKTIGQQEEAIASYRKAIAVKPDHAEAYWSLANLKTFHFTDREVDAMQDLLNSEQLPDESRAQIHNALGLEYENREDYKQAFENFDRCNHVRRQAEVYDPVETESITERLIEIFDADFLGRNAGEADSSITPILVVGLPRSGSTLIEQILASHSQVDGTHELGDLSRAVQTVRRKTRRHSHFPEALSDLSTDDWHAIGKEYLQRTEIFRGNSPFFVDKNPNNFIYAGVLKLALPNCKIINAKRHPLDSCLGSFKQLFASGQPFTYDMTELGEYYLQYARLMDHWHKVLPGFVLDVQYEHVVADLESQVRRILEYCGLPFEEQCLRFHETERAVKTASSEQVRRPIYSSSVNLWRNYEAHLDELVHILEPLLGKLPTMDQPAILADRRST
ncbi:MAG: sulfotransferase [Proteobacteria bacterium]|nr:sulfotransferase [Pseudomonadota bacterium]MDA0992581.1 sulfotransferase [Pseudomonadota bacterium]